MTEGLEATEPEGLPTVQPVRDVRAPEAGKPTGLLITDEDCSVEEFDLAALDIQATATLASSHLRSPLDVSEAVVAFERGALADTAARLGHAATALEALHPDALAKWARQHQISQIVTPFVTRGPLRDWLNEAEPLLAAQGVTLCEVQRDWDKAIWPYATAGFFKVKKQIPQIIERFVTD